MATNVLTIALALALAGVIASILHGLRMRRDVAGLQLFVDQAVEQTMRHPARLSVVRRLIDHGGVPELDALVEATATLLKVPCCAVTILDDEDQMMVAAHGVAPTPVPEEDSYCRFAVTAGHVFRVTDADDHPLVCESPARLPPFNVESYLGVPVSLGGWVLGTLCVWDHEPREWTRAEEETLTRLAAEVEARFAAIFEGTAPA
jgi:GAF domain-containing protein